MKTVTKIVITLIAIILCFLSMYGVFAFIMAESNPFTWSEGDRFLMIFLALSVAVFSCIKLGMWFEK